MTDTYVEQVAVNATGPVQASFTEFFLPPELRPMGIAKAPDGRMWFSVPGGIGVVSPSGSKRLFMRGPNQSASHPTPDSTGRIWFLDRKHKIVSWINGDGSFSNREIFLGSSARPTSLALSRWGEICVASIHNDTLVMVDESGVIRTIDGPPNDGVVAGPMDAMWGASSSTVSANDRAGSRIEYSFLPPERSLRAVICDHRDILWMIDAKRKSILHRVEKGSYREYVLGWGQEPYCIAADGSGDIWGTSFGTNGQFLFKLRQDGHLVWISPPPDDPMLLEVAAGDDGSLWVVDNWVARVIKVTLP